MSDVKEDGKVWKRFLGGPAFRLSVVVCYLKKVLFIGGSLQLEAPGHNLIRSLFKPGK